MSVVNIGGDPNDASYRYKMPKLITKIEGRGNGIKTVVVNMVDVAKALHCEPGYPTKFFGIELGAQSKFTKDTERAVVNGAHDQPDLARILEKFVDMFVLCPTCSLPEIKYKVKRETIKIDCAACGHNGKLGTNHKLVTYILNHPPTKKKKEGAEGMTKEERRKLKQGAKGGAEQEKKPKKDKKDKSGESDVWLTDTSKEAQEARKHQEFAEMNSKDSASQAAVDKIIQDAASDNKAESPVTLLKIFMATHKRTPQDVTAELRRLELSRGLDEPQKFKVLLEAVLDISNLKTVPAQFTAQAPLLSHLTSKGGNQACTMLIGCIENLVGVVEPKLLSRTPMILQALYEADVLEEEVLLAWADSPPESSWLVNKEVATNVRDKATPFIDWLKSAEESD
jgi:translation initiation factor 5